MVKQDSRRYPRFEVAREARVVRHGSGRSESDGSAVGKVVNLSASGVSLFDFDEEMGFDEGDPVDVEVSGMQPRHGRIVRIIDDSLAIDFNLQDDDEHGAIAELGVVTGELSSLFDKD